MIVPDDTLVRSAAEVARLASDGHDVSMTMNLLAAAAAQRDEASRHEMARQAAERAGQITDFARELLFGVIFHLV